MEELAKRDIDVIIARGMDIFLKVNLRRSARTGGSRLYQADGTPS
jgi:hypothetical protein